MFTRRVFVLMCVVALAACAAPTAPPPVQQTVVVPQVQTQVVQQTVVVPQVQTQVVQQTVVVPQTAVPAAKGYTIMFAGHQYFNMTFGNAPSPLEGMRMAISSTYPADNLQLLLQPLDGNKWHDNLVTYFTAQDPLMDIAYIAGYWVDEFGAADWLVPLQDKIDPKILAKFDKASLDTFTYKGNLIALGPAWGGIGGLYYRKDLLDAAGLKAPQTYDDMIADCDIVMKAHPEVGCWDWPAMTNVVLVNRWSEFLNGFGGQYVDANGQCAMNQPNGVAALTYMTMLFQKGYTPKAALNWKEEDAYQRFFAGTKLFYTGRQGDMLTLDDPKQSQVVGKWDFIPNPAQAAGKHSGFTEFWGFAISKYSTHIDEDIKMLNLWGDTPTMKIYDLAWGPIQGNMDVLKDADVLKANPNLPKVQAVAATALGPYPSTNYGQAADIMQTHIAEALAGMSTPQKALDATCKEINAIKPPSQ